MRAATTFDGVGDEALDLRLAQAGLLREANPADRVLRYRMRRLLGAAAGGCLAGSLAIARGFDPAGALMLIALGAGGAVAYGRGRLDRLIEQRRARIRIELYTVEQLLAVRLRVGASVASAVRRLVARSNGEVAGELREALRLHDSGMSLGQALRRIARTTPEPHAMRCYRTLAAGHEHGADVASSILALSDDVRDDRREALRRAATRGRALMLVPIVGILAPVLLLFVGAPLPWMVLRGLG
jgi:pilus assembly protein TadC